MSAEKKQPERYREIRNRRLRRDYFVEDTLEAGIVLTGTEVKSIRQGQAQINEAFVRIERGQAVLYHAHVSGYTFGNINNHEPYRPRLLLFHKRELRKLQNQTRSGGRALIPARIYFRKGLIKVEVALCRGKKLYDKREDLKKRAALREAESRVRFRP